MWTISRRNKAFLEAELNKSILDWKLHQHANAAKMSTYKRFKKKGRKDVTESDFQLWFQEARSGTDLNKERGNACYFL